MNTQKTTFLTSSEHRGDRIMLSFIFQGIGLFVMLSLISCMKNLSGLDMVMLQEIASNNQLVDNSLGILGAMISNLLVVNLFGVSAFMIPILFLIIAVKLLFPDRVGFKKSMLMTTFFMFWSSIAIDYYFPNPTTVEWYSITGHLVHRVAASLTRLLGAGVILFLGLGFFGFVVVIFAGSPRQYKNLAETVAEPIIHHTLLPPYKANRLDYYGSKCYGRLPHAELTSSSAYFATEKSFTATHATTPGGEQQFHTGASHFTVPNPKNANPPVAEHNPTPTQTVPDYQVEVAPTYIQPNLYIESQARNSGYKAANLIFADHNNDHHK